MNGVQEDPSVDTLPVCHKQVKRGLMLSSKLDTLRDMTLDTHIEPSSLTKVKDLGGGAFATGDRTWAYWDWMCSFVLLLNAGLTDVDLIYYSDTKQALSLLYCALCSHPLSWWTLTGTQTADCVFLQWSFASTRPQQVGRRWWLSNDCDPASSRTKKSCITLWRRQSSCGSCNIGAGPFSHLS